MHASFSCPVVPTLTVPWLMVVWRLDAPAMVSTQLARNGIQGIVAKCQYETMSTLRKGSATFGRHTGDKHTEGMFAAAALLESYLRQIQSIEGNLREADENIDTVREVTVQRQNLHCAVDCCTDCRDLRGNTARSWLRKGTWCFLRVISTLFGRQLAAVRHVSCLLCYAANQAMLQNCRTASSHS